MEDIILGLQMVSMTNITGLSKHPMCGVVQNCSEQKAQRR